MLKGNTTDRFIPARTPEREKKITKLQLAKTVSLTMPKRIQRFTFTKRHSNTNTVFHMSFSSHSHSSFDEQQYTSQLHKRLSNPKEHVYSSLLKTQLLSPLKCKFPSSNCKKGFTAFPLSLSKKATKKKHLGMANRHIHYDKSDTIREFDNKIKHELNLGIGYEKQMIAFANDSYNSVNNGVDSNSNTSSHANHKVDIMHYLSRIQRRSKPSLVKVLDAPGLIDDFYLHLLSWSKHDIISVGLKNELYLLNNKLSSVQLLASFPYHNICSCAFLEDPNTLSIGLNNGDILLYDIAAQKELFRYSSHNERIGVITSVPNNPFLFTSGSRDTLIHSYDKRKGLKPVITYTGSTQEICSLKWSMDAHILASGSNDNKLLFYRLNHVHPYQIFNDAHSSAIRALDWSKSKLNFLGTGGGVQDQTIKIWNCNTMELVQEINAESQICNLRFSKRNEMVTTHGFTDNLINVWKLEGNAYENITLLDSLNGHKSRVLYMAVGPNERTIATGSGDETVRIWEVFEKGDEVESESEVELKHNLVR